MGWDAGEAGWEGGGQEAGGPRGGDGWLQPRRVGGQGDGWPVGVVRQVLSLHLLLRNVKALNALGVWWWVFIDCGATNSMALHCMT